MKNRTRRVVLTLGFLLLLPFVSCAQQSKPETENIQAQQEVQHAFDVWMAAVGTGNAEAVSKLYEPDAVLLPTLSPKVANTPELRKEYFDVFTSKTNLKGAINEEHIRVYGDIAINSGLYTFTFMKDGATVSVPARFSFVYHKTSQGWMIVDHHSSKLPQE